MCVRPPTSCRSSTAASSEFSAIALVGVPDEQFCKVNLGDVVSIKTYGYTYKYDNTWTYTSGWRPNKCSTATIDVTYTFPVPKPSCNVCWEWTVSGCKGSYNMGDTCGKSAEQILNVSKKLTKRASRTLHAYLPHKCKCS